MRKYLLAAFLGATLSVTAVSAADVVIKLRPPVAIHEHRSERPSAKHVWIGGYHRWDGDKYVWEPGRWEVPPRERASWVPPRYEHRNGGYVFVEGHWR